VIVSHRVENPRVLSQTAPYDVASNMQEVLGFSVKDLGFRVEG